MPVFDEELHGDLCFGSFCPHYTVLNKLPAASALTLYEYPKPWRFIILTHFLADFFFPLTVDIIYRTYGYASTALDIRSPREV